MSTYQQQCDFVLNITRTAQEAGFSKDQLTTMIEIAWDALDCRAELVARDAQPQPGKP